MRTPSRVELERAARAAMPREPLERMRWREEGWTNRVLVANDRWVFRFPRAGRHGAALEREARVLRFLAPRLSAPVPLPMALGTRARHWPMMVYRKLPGRPLSDLGPLPTRDRATLGRFLLRLLDELSGLSTPSLKRLDVWPNGARSWARSIHDLERRYARSAERTTPARVHARLMDSFDAYYADLRAARFRPVATHRDLSADHLLWSEELARPTGVIDWEDVCVGDPAFDLTALAALVPEAFAALCLRRKGSADRTFERRIDFYRRVVPLHGLLFAIETQGRSARKRYQRALSESFEQTPTERAERPEASPPG